MANPTKPEDFARRSFGPQMCECVCRVNHPLGEPICQHAAEPLTVAVVHWPICAPCNNALLDALAEGGPSDQ